MRPPMGFTMTRSFVGPVHDVVAPSFSADSTRTCVVSPPAVVLSPTDDELGHRAPRTTQTGNQPLENVGDLLP